jgi:hypothetical protein
MSQPTRALKIVAASRQRRGQRIEAAVVAQRRKLHDAQAVHANTAKQVVRCEDDEHKLAAHRAEVTGSGFSIAAMLAMEQMQVDLAQKTVQARAEVATAHKQVLAHKQAVDDLVLQLARNRRQIDVVEDKVVSLVAHAQQEAEDAEADEIEEGAAASLAAAAG